MFVDFLTSKYHHAIECAYRAMNDGDLEKAERQFSALLHHHADPHMTPPDLAHIHAGLGEVALSHKDFFEATRWYTEARHLLDHAYGREWPKKLAWHHAPDRSALRTLAGLAHLSYAKGRVAAAKKIYENILNHDSKDTLGVKRYLEAISQKKEFSSVE